MKIREEDALKYHERDPKGKIEVVPTKPVSTQWDLSLAYSPGVAYPCLEIAKDIDKVYDYTGKGNLVAVLSNGSAVLGLGNIGPEASKPVMEGKAVLFKKFAGIDVFDIEINVDDIDAFVQVVKALEPTFGGINLEDIAAPASFEIETRLRKEMNIPVMHDDQHGTAIISSAALINALKLAEKRIEDLKMVVMGAGAAALACVNLYLTMGLKVENIYMFDRKGLIYEGRKEDMDPYKAKYGRKDHKDMTLEEAFEGADVFLGLSAGNVIKGDHIKRMAENPIVLALANPTPEISPEAAHAARKDVIMATGRSDYPNQVNNVLGFPYIFRGALDVRASQINEEMKIAAAHAIAEITHEAVPDSVMQAYGERNMTFGKEYLIPKPMDPRLITRVSIAVAKAAIKSGVAKHPIEDFEAYEIELQQRVGTYEGLTRLLIEKAKKRPKRIVFADADTPKILKAAQILSDEGIAHPILLGNRKKIAQLMEDHNLDLSEIEVIDPLDEDIQRDIYGKMFFEKRKRKGVTLHDACKLMKERTYFGSMMVEIGVADALLSGLTKNYPSALRPALQAIGKMKGTNIVAGMHIVKTKREYYFFADTTVNRNPDAEELFEITRHVANSIRFFGIEPRIAMLSYSNFGSNIDENTLPVIKATQKAKEWDPSLVIDGDVQANVALNPIILKENYGFSPLAQSGGANTFIFPNLQAGNIAYKLMSELAGAEVIGPILLGMKKPVHILQLGSSVRDIVNIATIAVIDAQAREREEVQA